ncbi:hypothetical protein ACL90Y_06965 [Micrococcus luteus]
MQLWMLTSLFGVAATIAVIYAVIRLFTNRAQREPLPAARSHGMVTALIALFAAGAPGLTNLVLVDELPWARGSADAPTGITEFPTPDIPLDVGLTALSPALWLPLVYWVAQRTWPASVAPRCSARLTARSWTEYLPRTLTAVVGGLALVALGATLWLWQSDPRPLRLGTGDDLTTAAEGDTVLQLVEPGVRSGAQVSPWLLAATVLFCLAGAAAVAAVVRRGALAGLSPTQDEAVRHVAVNRVLRTLALMLVSVPFAAATAVGYAQAEHGGATQPWAVLIALAVLIAMAGWRSPHLAVLRHETVLLQHEDGTQEQVEVPRGPGTLSDVLQLRYTAASVLIPVAGLAMALASALGPWLLAGRADASPALLAAGPLVLGLAVLWIGYLAVEFVLRMRHTDRDAAPRTRGVRASTWRVVLLGAVAAAGLVAAGWVVREQRSLARLGVEAFPLAVGVVAGLAVAGVLTAVGVRVCLHRRPLSRTSSLMDRRLRRRAADRMVGIGTTGMLMVFVAAGSGLLFNAGLSAVAVLPALIPAVLPGTSLGRPIGDAEDPADGAGEPGGGGRPPSSGREEAAEAPVTAEGGR